MLAVAIADPQIPDPRDRELLSSVVVSGSCTRTCPRNQRLFGTGEIIGRRRDGEVLVLTARHVVSDMTQPEVYLRNGTPEGTRVALAMHERRGRPAEVIVQSPDKDLAVVGFWPTRSDAFSIATLATDGGLESGNVVGGPNGALWTVSPYRAIAPDGESPLVACRTCGPGDSGGGVFDRRGALAGVLVSQQVLVKNDEPLEFATRSERFKIVPLADVRTFVATLPERRPTPAAVSANDPWSRFNARPAAPPLTARPDVPRDPWARFGTRGEGGV
jgi:hypothetical protein